MHLARAVERTVRNDGRRVLAGLIRLTGDFDAAEDSLQEAYARAIATWRDHGIPSNPGAWLNTVARRIAIDRMRRDRRAELPKDLTVEPEETVDPDPSGIEDDRLRLLFVCCHPALAPDARCALALRMLGGLTTREIARAFVEPEATTAQRIVRAKKKIREAKIPYEVPPRSKLPERIDTVLSVLYFIFNEGYASTDTPSLLRPDLAREAVRLARLAVDVLPGSNEAHGLLALMLLTDARRDARVSTEGELVPLDEQDRSRWDRAQIAEGVAVLDAVLARRESGPYQIQAAIAALHSTAPTSAATDWPQISLLYRKLLEMLPTPVVELNAAIAHGFVHGPEASLEMIARIERGGDLANYHLLHASKGALLLRAGRREEAADAYHAALALVTNDAERRYLERRLGEATDGRSWRSATTKAARPE